MDHEDIGALAADYEFFGEAADLMDMRVLKGHGIAAIGGMGGALLTEAVFGMDSVRNFFDGDGTAESPPKPGWRALAQLALGIVGGRVIYHFEGPGSHPAAYGFVGQVAGSAGAGGAMMLYHQYAAPDAAETTTETGVQGLGRYRRRRRAGGRFYGLNGETEVTPVAPYYDRYKVSVPQGSGRAVQGLHGEEVTRANYLQTNGLGQTDASSDGQPAWPMDEETPDVGTWIG